MFENIICQDEIVGALRDDIASGRLPSSLLLWGPDFSGKLSVALELARVLSCEEKDRRVELRLQILRRAQASCPSPYAPYRRQILL